jgi:hypothetical protein
MGKYYIEKGMEKWTWDRGTEGKQCKKPKVEHLFRRLSDKQLTMN